MILYVQARSPIEDAVIDYIEMRSLCGKSVSLNWEYGYIERIGGAIHAQFVDVYFGDERADGRLGALTGMQVSEVGMYSDRQGEGEFPLIIERMEFYDRGKELVLENAYTRGGCETDANDCRENSGMSKIKG